MLQRPEESTPENGVLAWPHGINKWEEHHLEI